jgi:hypothetical protein
VILLLIADLRKYAFELVSVAKPDLMANDPTRILTASVRSSANGKLSPPFRTGIQRNTALFSIGERALLATLCNELISPRPDGLSIWDAVPATARHYVWNGGQRHQ